MNKGIFSSICGFRNWKTGTTANGTDKGHKHLLTFQTISRKEKKIEGNNQIFIKESIRMLNLKNTPFLMSDDIQR